MALSIAKYVDRVRRLAIERGVDLRVDDIESSLDNALQQFAEEVSNSTLRHLLVKDYTSVTYASGKASLATLTDILVDRIVRVIHSDGSTTTEVSLLPIGATRRDLTYERNQIRYWGCYSDDAIYLMAGDGVTVPGDGTLQITSSFIPVITTVPEGRLSDDLIQIGYNVARGINGA